MSISKNAILLLLAAAVILTVTACMSPPVRMVPHTSAAQPNAADPAPAVQAETVIEAAPDIPKDYLPDGHSITGFHLQPFEATLYDIPFVVADTTDFTDALDGWMWATPVIPVPGYTGPDKRFYTPYSFHRTKPARDEELEIGMYVFAAFDSEPREPADLARNGHWQFARIKDLSRLGDGIVVVEFHSSYWNEWRFREYHINNVRVVGEIVPDTTLRPGDGPLKI